MDGWVYAGSGRVLSDGQLSGELGSFWQKAWRIAGFKTQKGAINRLKTPLLSPNLVLNYLGVVSRSGI
mgnify:CR=1 FL=1